jgi:hypothetical protein
MKKQYSILAIVCALSFSLFLTSCGQKRDEALVTEFNSKKTEADSIMNVMSNGSKMMMSDHAAWSAKLDSAGKAGADMAKITDFKAQMKKMEDMGSGTAMMDSMHAYMNAKTETNDQLKAAIAGLSANITACNTMCGGMMDAHKKLGADIMAFLGGAATAAPAAEAPKEGAKKEAKTTTTTTTTTTTDGMDMSKHAVKPSNTATPRRGGGATIKQ